MDLYNIHMSFDAVQDDIELEKSLQPYIDEYAEIKDKLAALKDKINRKVEGTNFYFDDEQCLLLNKNNKKIFLNYYFKFIDKKTREEKIIFNSVLFDGSYFDEIKKYLTNDKEKICELLNSKDLLVKYEPFVPILECLSNLFCGICLTNNILNITKDNYDKNVVYSVELNQIDNKQETFYGNIVFMLSDEVTAKKALEKIKENR